jgi:hypothetical protein
MTYYEDDIVAEVRHNREELLLEHGGIEGYLKYLQAQRRRWEALGFKFFTPKRRASPVKPRLIPNNERK